MNKDYRRSVVVRLVLALALAGSALSAQAITVSYGGSDYRLTTVTANFSDIFDYHPLEHHMDLQVWWGDEAMAMGLAAAVGTQLGTSNPGGWGPLFAIGDSPQGRPAFGRGANTMFMGAYCPAGSAPCSAELAHLNKSAGVYTFAILDTTPVPLPGALWLFASAVAGLAASRRRR